MFARIRVLRSVVWLENNIQSDRDFLWSTRNPFPNLFCIFSHESLDVAVEMNLDRPSSLLHLHPKQCFLLAASSDFKAFRVQLHELVLDFITVVGVHHVVSEQAFTQIRCAS